MYGEVSLATILLFMLYGAGAMMALIACLYLLLRRGNAFAPHITTPRRLRRWTTVFFAVIALGHFWYLPSVVFKSPEAIRLTMLVGALLDCMTVIPLAIVILFCMLQDRRRPLWPVGVMTVPLVAAMVAGIVTRSETYMPMVYGYLLLLGIGLTVYMVRAVRQYGRWLRDNYADLEHKEVWQTFVMLAVILLVFSFYVAGGGGMAYEYICQVCGIVLICHLLWRVETLSDLSITHLHQEVKERTLEEHNADVGYQSSEGLSSDSYEEIGNLLQQHCIDTQLYLQHDLTVTQLAQALGTNRFYLSQYFSRQDTSYNAYINDLRIHHFVGLYREATHAQNPISAKQLALESGYRSYSTFSLAFKQRMGQSVTAWIHQQANQITKL